MLVHLGAAISRTLPFLYQRPSVPTLSLRKYTVMLGLPVSEPMRVGADVSRSFGSIPLAQPCPLPLFEPLSMNSFTRRQYPPSLEDFVAQLERSIEDSQIEDEEIIFDRCRRPIAIRSKRPVRRRPPRLETLRKNFRSLNHPSVEVQARTLLNA
jgi:hypothetical protein